MPSWQREAVVWVMNANNLGQAIMSVYTEHPALNVILAIAGTAYLLEVRRDMTAAVATTAGRVE